MDIESRVTDVGPLTESSVVGRSETGSSQRSVQDRVMATDDHPGVDHALERLRDDRRQRRGRHAAALVLTLIAALLVIIPGVVAYRLSQAQEPVYEAQADVMYDIERAAFGEADKIMANAKVVAERREFAVEIAATEGLAVDEIVRNLSVAQVTADDTATSILRFRVRSPDQESAGRQADQWVAAFLAQTEIDDPDVARRAQLEDTIEDLQLARVDAQQAIDAAEQAREDTELGGLSTTRRAQISSELDRAVVAAGSRYDEIISDINAQARLLEQLEPEGIQIQIEQLTAVHVGDEPVSPRPTRDLALGLAVGLVLASAFVFLVYQLRQG